MYKITRVVEVSRNTFNPINFNINKYINEELQEDEFLLNIEYFKDNCKCQSKYVKKIQNKNVHFIHLPFGKNL